MTKSTPILIIGFGSIGQRHYRNLLAMGYRNVYVYDTDKKRVQNEEFRIENLRVKTLKNFSIVFICTPNHLHIKHALMAVRAGCHIFIEKPLSHNLKGVAELSNVVHKNKLVNMVACNLRFHPCVRFTKDYLEKEKLGQVYSLSFEGGYFLPFWRPYRDYRKNYATKKESGGGIILDGIHEFDLLFWFNQAQVRESKFMYAKVGNLQIDVEDVCFATFVFANKVLGVVKCDYLQKAYSRNYKIVGEKGNLEWDYRENIVWLKNEHGSKKLFEIRNYDINNFYIEEMKYFLDCVKKRRPSFNKIHDARHVLKYCVQRR